jgi:hypothetical protein
MWSDADDAIIAGDLTAGLAYVTPAGGAVVTPVAPIGLRDREAATVTFTTSLGFGRKLERIRSDPRVALAYHAREHGFATEPRFVLVQGQASADTEPDKEVLEQHVMPASTRFMGPPKKGLFWDRWLDAYYADRVLVTVHVQRVVSWPDLACEGQPSVTGEPLPEGEPPSQQPPAKGAGPRVDCERAARRLRALPHVLLGYAGADGYPMVVAASVGASGSQGIAPRVRGGGRRAGPMAHRYEPKLIGLETRQYRVAQDWRLRAPHRGGFRAPANKTLLLLAQRLHGQTRAQEGARGARGAPA